MILNKLSLIEDVTVDTANILNNVHSLVHKGDIESNLNIDHNIN